MPFSAAHYSHTSLRTHAPVNTHRVDCCDVCCLRASPNAICYVCQLPTCAVVLCFLQRWVHRPMTYAPTPTRPVHRPTHFRSTAEMRGALNLPMSMLFYPSVPPTPPPTCAAVLCLAQCCVYCLYDWVIVGQAVKLVVEYSLQ